MSHATDAYMGWQELQHTPQCRRPVWEVDTRAELDRWRNRGHETGKHECVNEDCEHGDRVTYVTVRILCRGCGVVHALRGEDGTCQLDRDPTKRTGYGEPPRKVAGLYLYPGPMDPWKWAGVDAGADTPDDFLVTREKVARLTPENVVGGISSGLGRRGGVVYSAGARPTFAPSMLYGPDVLTVKYEVVSDAKQFRTVPAAAKWIAANLAGQSVSEPVSEASA